MYRWQDVATCSLFPGTPLANNNSSTSNNNNNYNNSSNNNSSNHNNSNSNNSTTNSSNSIPSRLHGTGGLQPLQLLYIINKTLHTLSKCISRFAYIVYIYIYIYIYIRSIFIISNRKISN